MKKEKFRIEIESIGPQWNGFSSDYDTIVVEYNSDLGSGTAFVPFKFLKNDIKLYKFLSDYAHKNHTDHLEKEAKAAEFIKHRDRIIKNPVRLI